MKLRNILLYWVFFQHRSNFNNSEIRPNTNSKQYAHLLYINNINTETSVNRPAMGPENLDGFEGLVRLRG
jgi:hypothetical protein